MSLHKVYGISGSDLKAIEVDGQLRVLGCLPSPEPADIPLFSATFDLSAMEPRESSLRWLEQPVLDQGNSSSCNGHACVVAAQRTWALSGQPPRRFSPWATYALINGGRDAGSSLEDGVKSMRDVGLFPNELIPQRLLWARDIPSTAYPIARRSRVHDVLWPRNFQEMLIGLSLGFCGVAGIPVGRNFSRLDRDGAVPKPDEIIGYHAIEIHGATYSKLTGRWLALFQNSWARNWNDGGFAKFSIDSTTGPYFRAFLIRVLTDDPEEKKTDPPRVQLSSSSESVDEVGGEGLEESPLPPLCGNEDVDDR